MKYLIKLPFTKMSRLLYNKCSRSLELLLVNKILRKGGKGMLEFNVEKINIPLKQHVGGPCQAIVNVGDHVKRGQLVATPNGLGANIHASLSGVVEEVNDMAIIVKLDKEQSDDYVRLEKTDDKLQKLKMLVSLELVVQVSLRESNYQRKFQVDTLLRMPQNVSLS